MKKKKINHHKNNQNKLQALVLKNLKNNTKNKKITLVKIFKEKLTLKKKIINKKKI